MRKLVLAVALAAACAHAPAPPAATAPKREPVVVAIVVDQLSAWVADERVPLLPAGGFFARMRKEGAWVHALRLSYAQTDTAPGHASLHTGKVPAESGVVLNELPTAKSNDRVSWFRDASTKLVTPKGTSERPGSSSARLVAETVSDRLRAARPDAKILSFSLKDRAALIPGGQRPTHAIWYDATEGSFVTSTAVEPTFPAWALSAGDAQAIAKARSTRWTASDAAWLAAHGGADDAPGEGDLDGLGTVFPHTAKTSKAFRATPMADAALLDLALAGAFAERDPRMPLLLLLSLSTSDVIGHTFGPSSWEAWDQLYKLDAALERFVVALEAKLGPVAIVLAADHGNVAMPEARVPFPARCDDALERPLCITGGRLFPDQIRDELEAALDGALGKGDWVFGVSDAYVFLTDAARALDDTKKATIEATAKKVLADKHGKGLAAIYSERELAAACPAARKTAEGILALVCRSWRPGAGAGDFYLVAQRGWFFDAEMVPGKGSSHGTPYLHDRTVPMFVRDNALAGRDLTAPIDFSAYAAIQASFLGLDPRSPERIVAEAALP